MSQDTKLAELEEKLGCHYQDRQLLKTALTHSSFSKEYEQSHKGQFVEDYERLEFLGDAVLELVTSEMLYKRYHWPEGRLTKTRAQIVCEESLSWTARRYGLGEYIRFSVGEEKTGGRNRSSILCDVVESLIGALYLDQGLEEARKLIERILFAHLSKIPLEDETDYKSRLQEYLQGQQLESPRYETILEEGPPHQRIFTVRVYAAGLTDCTAKGHSKKQAEQKAAQKALEKLHPGQEQAWN